MFSAFILVALLPVSWGGAPFRYEGSSLAPPEISVTPSSPFDFGDLDVGTSSNTDFTLSNTGTDTLAGIVSMSTTAGSIHFGLISGDGAYAVADFNLWLVNAKAGATSRVP